MANCIDHLRLDCGTSLENWIQQRAVLTCECKSLFGSSPEFRGQMTRRLSGKSSLATELIPVVIRKPSAAVEDVIAGLRSCMGQSQSLLYAMNRVFGHRTVRSPLAAHDADEPAGRIHVNHNVAGQLLCVAPIFPVHKRPRASTATDDHVGRHRARQILI